MNGLSICDFVWATRIVKLLRVVTIDPPDDEIHFVLQERHPVSEHSESPNDFAQAEARKIAKKEASRLDRHGRPDKGRI